VIELCNTALKLQSTDKNSTAKAYLRRGLVYEKLDKTYRAKSDLMKVKELDPGNIQAS